MSLHEKNQVGLFVKVTQVIMYVDIFYPIVIVSMYFLFKSEKKKKKPQRVFVQSLILKFLCFVRISLGMVGGTLILQLFLRRRQPVYLSCYIKKTILRVTDNFVFTDA